MVAELTAFLESACDVSIAADSAIRPGEDLIDLADTGLSCNVLVLVLSPASNPARWPRDRWEPVLFDDTAETQIATFLLEECAFPALLRRQKFFDATAGWLAAMRRLKRWLWGLQAGVSPSMAFAPDLEVLYAELADKPGTLTVSGDAAERFAHQAIRDFAAVLWIPCHERSLLQIVGEIGAQLEMVLDGPSLDENCDRVRSVLSRRRCLLVLDAPQVAVEPLLPSGRASVLLTTEPVQIVADDRSLGVARTLAAAGRLAEAYEIFYELFHAEMETEACARELAWICEQWGRIDEANTLRFHFGPAPAEQLLLF